MDDPITSETTEGFGLMFFNARWMDPQLGRFTQADSIIPESQGVQAWDRYAFVNNNPVRYTDPTGHMCREDGKGCDGADKVGQKSQSSNGCGSYDKNGCLNSNRRLGAKAFSVLAAVTDFVALGSSVVGSITETTLAISGVAAGGLPGAAIGFFDGIVQYNVNPLLNPLETLLGWTSFAFTATSDALANNTTLSFDQNSRNLEVAIGQDTLVSFAAAYTGAEMPIGEALSDTIINTGIFIYDIGRLTNKIPTSHNLTFSIPIP
jgi:RHS repeat-associated protein